jgi:hypothetical protein
MFHVVMDHGPCPPSHPSHLISDVEAGDPAGGAGTCSPTRSLSHAGQAWYMVGHGAWGMHQTLCTLASSRPQAVETGLCCWRMRNAGCLQANIELNHERGVQPGWG